MAVARMSGGLDGEAYILLTRPSTIQAGFATGWDGQHKQKPLSASTSEVGADSGRSLN